MKTEPNKIQINGREVTLTYDKFALARFGRHGGNFLGLMTQGMEFWQKTLLLWAALDDDARARYPDPIQLVAHVEPQDDANLLAAVTAASEAGWLKGLETLVAEQLQQGKQD